MKKIKLETKNSKNHNKKSKHQVSVSLTASLLKDLKKFKPKLPASYYLSDIKNSSKKG